MAKFIIAFFSMFMLMASPALAVDVLGKACDSTTGTPNSSVCQDHASQTADGNNPVNHIIHVAADIVAGITGAIAIIMIIFSGYRFVTGGGSPESITKARNTLLWAVVGLAVIALAWTILNYAVDKLITN